MAIGKSGSLTWTSGSFTVQVNWSETYEVSSNTSKVTINSIQVKSSSYYQWQYYPDGAIKINGTTVKTINSSTPTGYVNVQSTNTFYTIKTGTSSSAKDITCNLSNIPHNANGSKSINIELDLKFYTTTGGGGSGWRVSGAKSITLTTIPRASIFNSLSCNTSYFNGTLTYKYTPQSASFYNQLNISIKTGSDTYTSIKTIKLGQKTVAQQTGTVTLVDTELSTIYGKLPTATEGTLRFALRTYSDSGYSTLIGDMDSKDISLAIPTTVVPKLGQITLSPVEITTVDGTSRNILVQNKNTIKVSISGCAAGSGSSIKSYTFAVLSGSTTIATITTTSTSATFGPFSQTGNLKFRVTVTDNRLRSTNNSGSEPTQKCEEYDAPYFSSFEAYRCNSSGTAEDNGTYMKYSLGVNYSSVNSTNNVTVKIYYKKSSDSSWTTAYNALTNSTTKSASEIIKNSSGTSITFGVDSTYVVRAEVIDNYNGNIYSSTCTIFGASRILNIRSDGNGIAFGKMAETDNLFESKWPAKFNDDFKIVGDCNIDGNLTVGTSTQDVAPTTGISVHDVRNVAITPNSFGDKNVNFYFDQIDSRWMSILHMKGWTGNYAAWELAGNSHSSSNDNTLKYRQGTGDTFGDWQTVLTNKNIGSYAEAPGTCLPLSGGTLTGSLTLPKNLYYTDSKHGLNCNNSDIIGVDGIYFADTANTAQEGIHFIRSDNNWDTLYAINGALKFHPNRATSTTLGGYTILNGNNFRRGTCTLSSSSDTTVTFSSALGGTPTVMLTPLTATQGIIPGKVKSVSSTGFVGTIGGTAVSSAVFAYLAIYN